MGLAHDECICSVLFGNLRYFEIALHILLIAKIRTWFWNCATRLLRNLEMEASEQDTPVLDSSDHTFMQ